MYLDSSIHLIIYALFYSYDCLFCILIKDYFKMEIYGNKYFRLYHRSYIRLYDVFENSVIFITWSSLIVKLFYDYYSEFKFDLFLC